jgi:hypothetical protein
MLPCLNIMTTITSSVLPKRSCLEADLGLARAENLELELHGRVVGKRQGVVRLLSCVNHAMGDYMQQINEWLAHHSTPDGKLNYGRENIIESYYTLHLWRGIYPSFDLQYLVNPGYNRARGPVIVPSLRLHVEF